MCEFRHLGSSEFSSTQDSCVTFEEGLPSVDSFLNLWPLSEQGTMLIYGEEDFLFTWSLSKHFPPEFLLATSGQKEEYLCLTGKIAIKERVIQLSKAGIEVKWGVELQCLYMGHAPVISWEQISCVLWMIRRDKNEEALAKRLLEFFSSLSVMLLSEGRADIAVILTMYNDQFSRCQVCSLFPTVLLLSPLEMLVCVAKRYSCCWLLCRLKEWQGNAFSS